MTTKRLALRREDQCAVCSAALAVGDVAVWDSDARTVTCLACDGRGEAGASAFAEGTRQRERQLKARRELIEDRPNVGRIAVGLSGPATAGQSWLKGAAGEEELGAALNSLQPNGVLVLHDRAIPRTKANIDHIAVCANGVYVIDAKAYTGRVEVVDKGGWFRSDIRLQVNGRNRTNLVEGVVHQVDLVRAALLGAGFTDIAVLGRLCFVEGDFSMWKLLRKRPSSVEGVEVTWIRQLTRELLAEGPLDADARLAVKDALAHHFVAKR